ncbi:MAG TPA: glutamate 5-kinase, partial [Gammaproteobacteria bacterium]|nr:glutamate 5-kinase [Gammaproteobacteria bacterium]
MNKRQRLTTAKRWVVKIGSALMTNDGVGLDRAGIADWVRQMAQLREQGMELLLVSSGAVAEGMARLGWKQRPHELHRLQAAAAVGQMGLVEAWESAFGEHGLHTAQILLTHEDLSDRQRYLNARSTVRSLLELGVVPVINENDTVVTDEIRFGDNDTLGALAANLVEADHLIILTDQAGLYDRDPRQHADARLIPEANANDTELDAMAGETGGALGRGGMASKVRAARLAARSGTCTLIAPGREADVLLRLRRGEELGT